MWLVLISGWIQCMCLTLKQTKRCTSGGGTFFRECTSGGVMYPVFTHMPGESYCRQLRSLLLCYIFWALPCIFIETNCPVASLPDGVSSWCLAWSIYSWVCWFSARMQCECKALKHKLINNCTSCDVFTVSHAGFQGEHSASVKPWNTSWSTTAPAVGGWYVSRRGRDPVYSAVNWWVLHSISDSHHFSEQRLTVTPEYQMQKCNLPDSGIKLMCS